MNQIIFRLIILQMKKIITKQLSTKSKQRNSKWFCTQIDHPGIEYILDSCNEGFFNKKFDPHNVVDSFRKDNVFNRKIPFKQSLEQRRLRIEAEQEAIRFQAQKIINCDVSFIKKSFEESKFKKKNKNKNKKKKIIAKQNTKEDQEEGSLKQYKQNCYSIKLQRNRLEKKYDQYRSDEFHKLGVDLPQIKMLIRGDIKNSSIKNLNIKSSIQPILQPLSFSRFTKDQRQTQPKNRISREEGDCIPSFLINPIIQTNQLRRSLRPTFAEYKNSFCSESFRQKRLKKLQKIDFSFHTTEATQSSLNASRLLEPKIRKPLLIEGESMVLNTLPQF